MTVRGFIYARTAGRLQIDKGADVAAVLYVDGAASPDDVLVGPGAHAILIDGTLTGDRWRLVPTWNGADLWSSPAVATVSRPSKLDRIARPARASLKRQTGAAATAHATGSISSGTSLVCRMATMGGPVPTDRVM